MHWIEWLQSTKRLVNDASKECFPLLMSAISSILTALRYLDWDMGRAMQGERPDAWQLLKNEHSEVAPHTGASSYVMEELNEKITRSQGKESYR